MSLSETYLLASKVRSKLTKDASNAKVNLRNLVTQANMLDNLMDYIQVENEKRLKNLNSVKFNLPHKPTSSPLSQSSLNVNEYEIESDDDDYYYSSSSDEEEEEEEEYEYDSEDDEYDEVEQQNSHEPSFKLSTINEEDEHLPELTISSDEESDEEIIINAKSHHSNHNPLFNKKLNQEIYAVDAVY